MPRFTHDCDTCTFLGSDEGHDFYFCGSSHPFPTVIARYGSDGPEYASGLEIAEALAGSKENHPLVKALRLAQEKGLLP